MKIIYNKVIPFKGFVAMNLFGCLFVRKEEADKLSEVTINHETIHTMQQREMLYVFFYLWYVIEWFVKFFTEGDFHSAYRAVGFEREAFANQSDKGYLEHRRHYAWIKLIITKKI